MNNKHQPATTLPWIALPGMYDGEVKDYDYLRHSANAYPRLVEALRDLLKSDGSMRKMREVQAAALLRDLGEL